MTTTLTDLINEVQINLAGYTYQQDRATHLTSAVSTLTSPSTSAAVNTSPVVKSLIPNPAAISTP